MATLRVGGHGGSRSKATNGNCGQADGGTHRQHVNRPKRNQRYPAPLPGLHWPLRLAWWPWLQSSEADKDREPARTARVCLQEAGHEQVLIADPLDSDMGSGIVLPE